MSYRAVVPVLFVSLLSGGCLAQSIASSIDSLFPEFEGGLAGEVETTSEVDERDIVVGLFAIDVAPETDVDGNDTGPTLSVDNETAAPELLDAPAEGLVLQPVASAMLDERGGWDLSMPEQLNVASDPDDENAPPAPQYVVLAWHDADGDGQLTLGSVAEDSELARAPQRMLQSGEDKELMTLTAVEPLGRGEWLGRASVGRLFSGDYHDNHIDNDERDGWSIEL